MTLALYDLVSKVDVRNVIRAFLHSQLPARKSFSIIWHFHIIQTHFLISLAEISSSSTFKTFGISIFIDIKLIIELWLRITRNSLITLLAYHRHIVVNGLLICLITFNAWIIDKTAIQNGPLNNYCWVNYVLAIELKLMDFLIETSPASRLSIF